MNRDDRTAEEIRAEMRDLADLDVTGAPRFRRARDEDEYNRLAEELDQLERAEQDR